MYKKNEITKEKPNTIKRMLSNVKDTAKGPILFGLQVKQPPIKTEIKYIVFQISCKTRHCVLNASK